MKRAMAALLAVMALTYAGAVETADAHTSGEPQLGGVAPVLGTVVSTNPSNGTFVANAYVLNFGSLGNGNGGTEGIGGLGGLLGQGGLGQLTNVLGGILGHLGAGGGSFGGAGGLGGLLGHLSTRSAGPAITTTQVTISTDQNTKLLVDGRPATVSDLAQGDKFIALFHGSFTDSVQTLTASPALAVFAHAVPQPHQLYAFVGTVQSADTNAGTVTVTVTRSLPSGLAAPGSSATFTVGGQTLVLGGTGDGTLAGVSPGDIVAGGLVGVPGETLSQVESQPLKMLLDLPAPSGGNAGAHTKRKALKHLLALLEGKAGSHNSVGHKHHKHHKHK